MIWFVLTLCLLPIMLVVLWPFLRPAKNIEGADWTKASLKAALAAVDKDEARGVLNAAAADRQRAKIAADAEIVFAQTPQSEMPSQGRKGFIMAAASLVIAPWLLFGAYTFLGTPNPAVAQKKAVDAANVQRPEITLAEAISALEARLEDNPDNSQAWAALGDLKIRNDDLVGAEAAFERAVALPAAGAEEGARLWLLLAMTRRTQGRPLSDPSVMEPLKKSLELDANSPAAVLLRRIEDEAANEAP